MKAKTTFSILIWINSSRTKNNYANLYARVTVNQKRCNISLHKKIDIDKWDPLRNCVKGTSHKTRKVNIPNKHVNSSYKN